jgi:hypothetical protein
MAVQVFLISTSGTADGTLTGTVNSSNQVFVLPDDPDEGSIETWINPSPVSSTVSGREITVSIVPQWGDTVSARFTKTVPAGSGGGGTVTLSEVGVGFLS